MIGDEVRKLFLEFFEGKGHTVLPSSSLIPHGDPTLLLTTAGMVQVKPYFLGLAPPPNPRLASCQKCFRTTDIDSVGDTKHLTFFEMLGNFSVGDYFKREAISWGWEFVTKWLKVDPGRLWITVYLDDDDAFHYWRRMGVPAERIMRFGEKENFWGPAGDSGPCGPCSEIHYDYGEKVGCGKPDCSPSCDCARFVEVWNLVFTQYNQDKDGKRAPLPKPNIDTGMGLERATAMMQGVTSVFETDLFKPIVEKVCDIAGRKYGVEGVEDRAIRVVAEHGRAITFLIADGVVPGNDGRGYVLRRVLRRAALFGRKLGLREPFLEEVAKQAILGMKHVYIDELDGKGKRAHILKVINDEEQRFHEAVQLSIGLIDGVFEKMRSEGTKTISGDMAFHLYDTYGLPVDILEEMASDEGFDVDLAGFDSELEVQRERARSACRFGASGEALDADYDKLCLLGTSFVGYDDLSSKTKILALIAEGESLKKASTGQEVQIILAETPFYGEMGGQVGDHGEIRGPKGKAEVVSTTRHNDLVVHHTRIIEGTLSVNEAVEVLVEVGRRMDIARNHTATHLLQAALRQVLGKHVHQAGSLVEPERLRFDFSHGAGLTKEEIAQVEQIVNEKIRQNLKVAWRSKAYTQAVSEGATALFGEKYGDEVRAVQIGPKGTTSYELCGGTHVKATGEIGNFRITTQSSIGSGTRRIEAVTGRGADEFITQRFAALDAAAERLQASPQQVLEKIAALRADLDKAQKRVQSLEQKLAQKESKSQSILDKRVLVNNINLLAVEVPDMSPEAMRTMGDQLKAELGPGTAIVLGTIHDDRPHFMAMVTPDVVARGFSAGEIVREVAKVAGGGGGGRAELGQGSGQDKSKIDDALAQAKNFIQGK